MNTYIYELYTVKDNKVFYVGQTKDITRRHKEHISAAKHLNNTEDKYNYIRKLKENNKLWDLRAVCLFTDDYTEDYHIYKLLCQGINLTNMKAGDTVLQVSELASDLSIVQFNTKVKEIETKAKLPKPKWKKRVFVNTDDSISNGLSNSKPHKTRSSGLQAIIDKRNGK